MTNVIPSLLALTKNHRKNKAKREVAALKRVAMEAAEDCVWQAAYQFLSSNEGSADAITIGKVNWKTDYVVDKAMVRFLTWISGSNFREVSLGSVRTDLPKVTAKATMLLEDDPQHRNQYLLNIHYDFIVDAAPSRYELFKEKAKARYKSFLLRLKAFKKPSFKSLT